jgi:hypothetical protein
VVVGEWEWRRENGGEDSVRKIKIWCGESMIKVYASFDLMDNNQLHHGGKVYYLPMLNSTL